MLLVGMVMCTVIMLPQHQLTWTWVFPLAATACSVTGSIRLRASDTAPQGFAWAMVALVFGIGAFCLLAIPAQY